MATLLSAHQTPVPCERPSPASPSASVRPAAAQRAAKPATPPSDFMRELHHILAALTHK
ncbi:hypothetical protein [Rugamonas apoptosis]|uniref:Uncharacterized protein n=1 Tax=Rugamonas apoptosis TaxID=2758570 RepID=A0A7W2F767_9BURK|nr:hypothetical protein [Rugamonas apoptosis]MBA5686381.1 hypothetical protein [Rugamonas apoptosis]